MKDREKDFELLKLKLSLLNPDCEEVELLFWMQSSILYVHPTFALIHDIPTYQIIIPTLIPGHTFIQIITFGEYENFDPEKHKF